MATFIDSKSLARYGGSWLLSDLLLGRISVSRISEFNDPFECHARVVSPETPKERQELFKKASIGITQKLMHTENLSKYKAKIKAEKITRASHSRIESATKATELNMNNFFSHDAIDKSVRVSCFVTPSDNNPQETPMWAYYGESHQGVRIHIDPVAFSAPEFHLEPMNYVNTPPQTKLSSFYNKNESNFKKIISSKSNAWAHENEIRILCKLKVVSTKKDTTSAKTERDYIQIDLKHIRRIDLGIKSKDDALANARKLRGINPELTIYKAIKTSGEYYPTYELIDD